MSSNSPRIEFVKSPSSPVDTAIIALFSDKKLTPAAKTADQMLGGLLQHHLDSNKAFKANEGQALSFPLSPKAPYLRVILLGLGDKSKMTSPKLETAGGKLLAVLKAQGSEKAIFLNAEDIDGLQDQETPLVQHIAFGLRLGAYSFDHYKTNLKDKEKEPKFKSLSVLSVAPKVSATTFEKFEQLADATFLARDLVNDPPNKLYPESFADTAKELLTPLGVKVDILDEKALAKQGFNLVLAVGQASDHLPRVVVMRWSGAGTTKQKGEKPLALVGKGITFDSGGLCLKPYEGMADMKMDMGGAAAVVGAMHMLASRKCKVPVVAVVALAENAISDEATRPSDIVTSYCGKTVEILNTDAEGRLVLADALSYVQKKFDPKLVINLATLTGAIMVALGTEYAGAFVNNEDLWKKLSAASETSGEKIWRMPLAEHFRKEMDSPFADIKNVGAGRYGGSSTAAAFLEEFIDKGRVWAHLDIAGVAMSKEKPTNPVPFASGYGVRLLNEFIEKHYG